tara:strand:- start:215 stop:1177 length:963 start_codon:yes stop_codon:yes gene_type:complete
MKRQKQYENVSVALATYNGEKYLKDQLDSIYRQTINNIEVVVVDDFSNDNTLSILKSYNKKYGLKYFVNNATLGVTKNFEKAISLCQGEFILLSDQDDIWRNDKIEILLKNIGKNSLIYSNADIIDENNCSKNDSAKARNYIYGIDSSNQNFYKYAVLNSFVLGCTIMFRQSLLKSVVPILDTTRNHDWFITCIAHQNGGVKYLDKKLTLYRHHKGNYSRNNLHLSFYKALCQFFSKEFVETRRLKILEQNAILNYFKENNIFSSKDEVFLNDMLKFTKSYLNSIIHLRAFLLAVKYHKYFYSTKNKLKNKLMLISKLIG